MSLFCREVAHQNEYVQSDDTFQLIRRCMSKYSKCKTISLPTLTFIEAFPKYVQLNVTKYSLLEILHS